MSGAVIGCSGWVILPGRRVLLPTSEFNEVVSGHINRSNCDGQVRFNLQCCSGSLQSQPHWHQSLPVCEALSPTRPVRSCEESGSELQTCRQT